MTTSSALCVFRLRIPMAEKSLVIFLHGIGVSRAQLMPLPSSWRSRLAAARFAAASCGAKASMVLETGLRSSASPRGHRCQCGHQRTSSRIGSRAT